MFYKFKRAFYFLFLLFIASTAFAGPWLLPGNLGVKSDIDLLADAGLIKAPVMTWPIAWVNIGPELLSPETKAKLPKEPAAVQEAYQRIVTLYQQSYQPYKIQTAAYASGSNKLNPFRTFQYQPYADFASGVSAAYQMKHFADSLNISYYNAPNQSYSPYAHIDNSYAYFLFGNWAIGFDQFNRWWGPGYSDSMILSQNAEPFPALGIQRMDAEAFKTKWLHWIGPWSVSSVVSENGPVDYPYVNATDNDLFWFTNITFRPLQSLQFDVTRNVLFSGRERPLTGPMLLNLITLQDSYEKSMSAQNAPGSEEWEVGTNLSLDPMFHIPVNFYSQTTFMCEDPTFFIPLPDYTTYLLGISTVTEVKSDRLRLYFEYENNITRFFMWTGKIADANAYGDGAYPYTYYNNILGSSLGANGVGYTLGAVLSESDGNSDTAMLRFLQLSALNHVDSIEGAPAYYFNAVPGTPGFPFAEQNVIWASFGKTIALMHHLGSLTPELGYLISLSNTSGALPSGFSATVTWSKSF
ncbi:MAG: hypothetical protein NTU49_06360 [Gammaproteobacteria bacterium]|nr:hypothetical protein [Gammaproteobacteria bacterium]